jgi:hypothetical protein
MLRPKVCEGFLSFVIIWPSATISLTPECSSMLQNIFFHRFVCFVKPFCFHTKICLLLREHHWCFFILFSVSLRAWTDPGMSWRHWLAGMVSLLTLLHQFISCGLILCLLHFSACCKSDSNRFVVLILNWWNSCAESFYSNFQTFIKLSTEVPSFVVVTFVPGWFFIWYFHLRLRFPYESKLSLHLSLILAFHLSANVNYC